MAVPNDIPQFLTWMDGAEQILDFRGQEQQVEEELAKAEILSKAGRRCVVQLGSQAIDFPTEKGQSYRLDKTSALLKSDKILWSHRVRCAQMKKRSKQ